MIEEVILVEDEEDGADKLVFLRNTRVEHRPYRSVREWCEERHIAVVAGEGDEFVIELQTEDQRAEFLLRWLYPRFIDKFELDAFLAERGELPAFGGGIELPELDDLSKLKVCEEVEALSKGQRRYVRTSLLGNLDWSGGKPLSPFEELQIETVRVFVAPERISGTKLHIPEYDRVMQVFMNYFAIKRGVPSAVVEYLSPETRVMLFEAMKRAAFWPPLVET